MLFFEIIIFDHIGYKHISYNVYIMLNLGDIDLETKLTGDKDSQCNSSKVLFQIKLNSHLMNMLSKKPSLILKTSPNASNCEFTSYVLLVELLLAGSCLKQSECVID